MCLAYSPTWRLGFRFSGRSKDRRGNCLTETEWKGNAMNQTILQDDIWPLWSTFTSLIGFSSWRLQSAIFRRNNDIHTRSLRSHDRTNTTWISRQNWGWIEDELLKTFFLVSVVYFLLKVSIHDTEFSVWVEPACWSFRDGSHYFEWPSSRPVPSV